MSRTQLPGAQIKNESIESTDIKDGTIADIDLTNSGVSAGVYTKITVNSKGRVTQGENPTTLAGYGITDAQPTDLDLTALANTSTTGLYTITGAGLSATRNLVAPVSGITITNSNGVAGNPTFALSNDLLAIENLSTTGIAVRSATDTWVACQIAGTTNRIVVSNGNGVSGNPTIDLSTFGVAGTYAQVTTDQYGRVSSGSTTLPWSNITATPTTLSGYGITDSLINLGGIPTIEAGTSLPATAQTGALFLKTDTRILYRWDGTQWRPAVRVTAQGLGGTFTPATGTTQIPADNTTPTSSEGTQVWTANFTPTSTLSTMKITCSFTAGTSTGDAGVIVALFRGTTCIATRLASLDTIGTLGATTTGYSVISFSGIDQPATTDTITYSLRIGMAGGSGTWFFSRTSGANLGNTMGQWIIEEIL